MAELIYSEKANDGSIKVPWMFRKDKEKIAFLAMNWRRQPHIELTTILRREVTPTLSMRVFLQSKIS